MVGENFFNFHYEYKILINKHTDYYANYFRFTKGRHFVAMPLELTDKEVKDAKPSKSSFALRTTLRLTQYSRPTARKELYQLRNSYLLDCVFRR